MSSKSLDYDPSQWFISKQQNFPFSYSSSEDYRLLNALSCEAESSFKNYREYNNNRAFEAFNLCCTQLSSIIKHVALEDNIKKISEIDCRLVGLSSYLEMCMQNGYRDIQQKTLNNYSKQINCLKSINLACDFYKNYESYVQTIKDSVPGVANHFSRGLPIDGFQRNFNSCIASVRNMNFGNIFSNEYIDLLKTREIALQRAKALHSKQQVSFMERYAREFPLDSQSAIFLDKRETLVKSIDSVLAKTALDLSENKSKSMENHQQTQEQEPASNKKTKSSPDIEL